MKIHPNKSIPFTLIELIMVISVLAVLMAITVPALLHLKEDAQQRLCAHQLRQIGVAAFLYMNDFDGRVMPAKFSTDSYNHWINYLYAQQFNKRDIFSCPSMRTADHFNPAGGDNEITEASYIMNIIEPTTRAWEGAAISSEPRRSMGWGNSRESINISQVKRPSQTIYIMDVAGGGIHANHSGIRRFSQSDHGKIIRPPRGDQVRRVGYHHRGKFNALMGDGRVKLIEKSDPDQWVAVIKP